MTAAGRRAWRWVAGGVAALAIGAAATVGAFRIAIAYLPELEAEVAVRVREQTGLALSFDALDARFGRYGPEVYFSGARIVGADHGEVLVTARAGRVSVAPLRSLLNRRVEIGRVILEAPRLDFLIFPDRHVELVGQAEISVAADRPRSPFTLERLPRGVLEIRDATFGFRDLGLRGADFELRHVDLELTRGAEAITVEGVVDLPRRLGTRLAIEARADGDLGVPRGLDWRLRLEGRDLDLAGFASSLPGALALPTAGRGTLRVTARGRGPALSEAGGTLQFANLEPGPRVPAAPAYARIAADFTLRADPERWQLSVRDLDLSVEGRRWEPGPLEAAARFADGRLEQLRLQARYLRLENLVPLAALAPPGAAREQLLALEPRGVLRDIELELGGFAPGAVPDLLGRFEFSALGIEPRGRVPGFDGLSGRLQAQGDRGGLELRASGASVDWPAEWREVIGLAALSARAGWQRTDAGLRLWAEDVRVDSGHGEVSGELRLLRRPGEPARVDLAARVRDFDVAQVHRYLPVSRIKPKPLAWLDSAFRAGRIVDAEVAVSGPTRGFPYRDGEGRFEARARVEELALQFAPDWPAAERLSVDVQFAGPGFSVTNARGELSGVQVSRAVAELSDWRESLLVLRAEAAGDARAVHRLLSGSPLGPRLGRSFARLEATGPIAGEATLLLPLKQLSERSVVIRAAGRGLRLGLAGLAEPVTGLTGELTVNNTELFAPSLAGEALGGRFEARIDTRGPSRVTVIEAAGTLDGARLPGLLGLADAEALSGTTSWRGSWTIERAAAGRPARSQARVESDLAGLASTLPAPLAKPSATRRPLRLGFAAGEADVLRVSAALDPDLRALLELAPVAGGRRLSRGLLRVGGGEPTALPVASGLRIDGRLARLAVSDLLRLRGGRKDGRPLQDWLSDVNLEVGRLEVLGYEFARVRGRMRPGNRGWDIEVESPAAAGRVLLPYDFAGDTALALDLERLHVAPRAAGGDGDADPRRLPALRVDVRDAVFDRYRLGHLTASLARRPDGLHLERFRIEHPAYGASGSGAWTAGPAGQRCSFDFRLESGDARGLLLALGFAPLIEAREAEVVARLHWPGPPDARFLARLGGEGSLRVTAGRMLSVDPGAGRILGLMSLAHLPRRLALDFDDLTDEGLAFDSISGSFTLADGGAYTSDLTLRGPATEVGIAGRTGLADRSYDQTAVVTGRLGASLGVAGALAGGPAVGAALFLFSQIFKEPLKGAVRAYYRITGPWDSPVVRKIDAAELKEAAGIAVAPGAEAATESAPPAASGVRP